MTNQYLWQRIGGPGPDIRAADSDREQTAERLRKSQAEGRLDLDEFQQRLESCYAAKTLGELRDLVRDLPGPGDLERRAGAGIGLGRRGLPRLVPVLIALVHVSIAIGHHVLWLWLALAFLMWRTSSWRRRRWSAAARRGPSEWI
jgi:hypothetical protein